MPCWTGVSWAGIDRSPTNRPIMPPIHSEVDLSTFVDGLSEVFPVAVESVRELLAPPSTAPVIVATTGGDVSTSLVVSYMADPRLVDPPKSTSFSVSAGFGMPSPAGDGAYTGIGSDLSAIPLVFHRQFDHGPSSRQEVLELAEDFRLFWNLFEDRGKRVFAHDDVNGDEVVVARVTDTAVEIVGPFLRRYLAARQLALVRQFTVDVRGGSKLDGWRGRSQTVHGPSFVLEAWSGDNSSTNYIRCQGVHVEMPARQDTCGVWPFEAPKAYLDFIVEIDPLGNEVVASSGVTYNDGVPFYLTPVHFTRSVLERYHGDPDRFSVEDGVVRGPTWSMNVDNARDDDVVIAFLGDLGRDLPEREARHWRTHNLPPDDRGLSDTAVRRNFLAVFAESTRVEHRFRAALKGANAAWEHRFGWPLFREPNAHDAHVLALHVPTNQSVKAFDEQIVLLAKATVDFLNESQIGIALGKKVKAERGITKLERLLESKGLDAGELLQSLRKIQGARTNSAAHRKGEDFDLQLLLDGCADLPELFAALLDGVTDGMVALSKSLEGRPLVASPEAVAD